MLPEIGSNFWEYTIEIPRAHKFWWENENFSIYFFKSGRNATRAVGTIATAAHGKKILLPAYLCETEVDPWKELGWSIYFYQIDRNLTINTTDLQEKIQLIQPDIVLVQSYFGFVSENVLLNEILENYRKSNGVVIEDITQSLFTDIPMCEADFYVASLRKFFAIPDGGVLISKKALTFRNIEKSSDSIDEEAQKAFDTKKEYFLTLKPETKNNFRNYFEQLNEQIITNDTLYEISPLSKKIFAHLSFSEISTPRIRNYSKLCQDILRIPQVQIVTQEIDDTTNCVPLYLSVYFKTSEIRNCIRAEMAKRDIYCPIIWPRLRNTVVNNSESLYIYDHILCLPIDQRYDFDDMKRISITLAKLCKELNGSRSQ